MTREEIITALRCCEQHKKCEGACPLIAEFGCIEKAMGYRRYSQQHSAAYAPYRRLIRPSPYQQLRCHKRRQHCQCAKPRYVFLHPFISPSVLIVLLHLRHSSLPHFS